MTIHLKESGHWYSSDGEPCYTQPDGKQTTLRHARKQNLVPSVTTILKAAAAPGLEIWKQNQLLDAAEAKVSEYHPATAEEWRQDVVKLSQERGKTAREQGTAGHAVLQGYFEGEPTDIHYAPLVGNVVECLAQNCGEQDWRAEKSFAHPLGFAGKVDLHCPSWVIDFKGTDKDMKSLKTWDDHAMQLAAYREGLHRKQSVIKSAKCAVVYFHRETFEARFIELDEKEVQRGWKMFESLLTFWKAQKGYEPS